MLNIDKLITDPKITFKDMLSTSQIKAIEWHLNYLDSALRLLKPRLANEATRESALKRLESYVKNNYFLNSDKAGMTDEQLLLANKFIKSIIVQKVSDLEIDFMPIAMNLKTSAKTTALKTDDIYPVLTDVVDPTNKILKKVICIWSETTQGDIYPVLTDVVLPTNKITINPHIIQKKEETGVIEKAQAQAQAQAQTQDVHVIPHAVTSSHQKIENKPQKSRLTTWLQDNWDASAKVVRRFATATAVILGGGAVSLAAAFAFSTQSPPEMPEAPQATPIASTVAATDVMVAQANVEPPPPVAVADTAPAAKMVKTTPSAKKIFTPVTENYKFSPAIINGVQLQKTSLDTIERMCKGDIQTWVCQKTPENV